MKSAAEIGNRDDPRSTCIGAGRGSPGRGGGCLSARGRRAGWSSYSGIGRRQARIGGASPVRRRQGLRGGPSARGMAQPEKRRVGSLSLPACPALRTGRRRSGAAHQPRRIADRRACPAWSGRRALPGAGCTYRSRTAAARLRVRAASTTDHGQLVGKRQHGSPRRQRARTGRQRHCRAEAGGESNDRGRAGAFRRPSRYLLLPEGCRGCRAGAPLARPFGKTGAPPGARGAGAPLRHRHNAEGAVRAEMRHWGASDYRPAIG